MVKQDTKNYTNKFDSGETHSAHLSVLGFIYTERKRTRTRRR